MPLDHFGSQSLVDCITEFSPELTSWMMRMRDEGVASHSARDFPIERIRQLAQLEQATERLRQDTLPYYVALAYGCLTTAFIMTQRHAAIRRIETSPNPRVPSDWLPSILRGDAFATVGISHLTTSRQHVAAPPVSLRWDGDTGILNGSIPWVTGTSHAKYIVAGAVDPSDSHQQYLVMLELPSSGVHPGPGMHLVALTSSCTDAVDLRDARIKRQDVLHGPHPNVMAASNTGGAGGLQTSALALGLAACAIEYLASESVQRPGLRDHATNLQRQWSELYENLIASSPGLDANRLRKGANDLALSATHAALSAAKGAGFVEGHPVGRWCQEALFFLVWSCPQAVSDAHLCTFSGWQI
jgi:alkylation response protein AidB-like acyl-CoA dehydrogenase